MTIDSGTELIRRARYPLLMRRAVVLGVLPLGPRMTRVILGGDDMRGFESQGAADHIKVMFPVPGETAPVLPTNTEDGMVWPEGAIRPESRDYTPRHFDALTNELTLDFVLHGAGVASDWARQAAPGHVLGIAGPRGSRIVGPGFDWYLLGGDETSIPSIARQIEMVGNHPAISAFIEVTDAADEQDIPHVTWLHRGSAMPGATTLLQEALRTFVIPAGQGFVSVSGEATGLTPIRRMLVQEKGLNREYVDISGHWKRDTRNWDHHEAIPE